MNNTNEGQKVNVNAANNKGDTALIVGANADHGNVKITQLLLDHGANVNDANNDGNTALMCAIDKSHSEIVKALLKGGANPDLKNNNEETAWDLAKNKPEILAILKKHCDSRA